MPGTQQIPVFPPFAVEANDPAGAADWNGTPTKVLPVPDYMLPNTKPPAQWFNYIFNAASAGTWFANGASQTVSGLNWGALVPLSTFNHSTANATMAACWHPQGAVWWVANVQNSNALDLWNRPAAIDAAWVNPSVNTMLVTVQKNAAPNQAFVALAPDPSGSGTVWLGIVEDATHCHVWTFNGTSYSAQTTVSVATGQATVVMHTFNGHVLLGIGSQTAADAKLYVQPGGTTPLSGVTCAIWRFADTAGFCIAFPGYTTGATVAWSSSDGVTWTPFGFSFLGAGESIFGCAITQDAYGPTILVGINTVAGHPRFVKSANAGGGGFSSVFVPQSRRTPWRQAWTCAPTTPAAWW